MREAAYILLNVPLIAFVALIGDSWPSSSEDAAMCSAFQYVGESCDNIEQVGEIDGSGSTTENPELLYSTSTTHEEEEKGVKTLSLRVGVDDESQYYKVVMEPYGFRHKIVDKYELTEKEAFEDRLSNTDLTI